MPSFSVRSCLSRFSERWWRIARFLVRGRRGCGLTLVHRDIQHPAEAVLNRPVTADDAREMGGTGREAGDENRSRAGGAVADRAFRVDAQDAAQPRPAAPTDRGPHGGWWLLLLEGGKT